MRRKTIPDMKFREANYFDVVSRGLFGMFSTYRPHNFDGDVFSILDTIKDKKKRLEVFSQVRPYMEEFHAENVTRLMHNIGDYSMKVKVPDVGKFVQEILDESR